MKRPDDVSRVFFSPRALAFSVDALLGQPKTKIPKLADNLCDSEVDSNKDSIGKNLDEKSGEATQNTPCLTESIPNSQEPKLKSISHSTIIRKEAKKCGAASQKEIPDLIKNKGDPGAKEKCTIELYEREMWMQFHCLGNEMIITKAGRRIFPALKVKVSGLDPNAHYILWVEIVPVDDHRYRYVYPSSQWTIAGPGDPPLSQNYYVHQDSPACGRHWMSQLVSFDKLKLTNNKQPAAKGQVALHSMHKYQPKIHIQRTNNVRTDAEFQIDKSRAETQVFPETVFITVTAYQNQQITRLKIASNPFAKGFREAIKTREEVDDLIHTQVTAGRFDDIRNSSAPFYNRSAFIAPGTRISLPVAIPYVQGTRVFTPVMEWPEVGSVLPLMTGCQQRNFSMPHTQPLIPTVNFGCISRLARDACNPILCPYPSPSGTVHTISVPVSECHKEDRKPVARVAPSIIHCDTHNSFSAFKAGCSNVQFYQKQI